MKRARKREDRRLGRGIFRALGLFFTTVLALQLLYGGAVPAESLDGLLRKGVRKYGRGEYIKALEHMIKARTVGPENPVPAFYAGLIMLRTGRIDDTIGWWRDYLDLDGGSEAGSLVRHHLTRLTDLAVKREAVDVISAGLDPTPGNFDPLTTVVVGFESGLRPEWDPLRRGLTWILIDDLSKVIDITALDGELVGGIMRAKGLVDKSLFAPGAAARIGRTLGGMTVTAGILTEPQPSVLDVKLLTLETTQDYVLGEHEVRVPTWRFWELEKSLAFAVLEALGYPKENLPTDVAEAIERVHTKSFEAILHYSTGLELLGKSRYGEARKAFEEALVNDGGFEAAREALAATPAEPLTIEQMITSAEEATDSLKARFSIREEPFKMDDGY